jgi:N-methylhydantoinase B/oxoprolinase/acetone carboxylase alpha subunit
MTKKIYPITIAAVWHYDQRVCRVMGHTAERAATNALVVALRDTAYGASDAVRRVIAEPEDFPPRLVSSTFRMRRVKNRSGKERPLEIVEEMIERTETVVGGEIAKWPEGTWSAEAAADDNGLTVGKPVCVSGGPRRPVEVVASASRWDTGRAPSALQWGCRGPVWGYMGPALWGILT